LPQPPEIQAGSSGRRQSLANSRTIRTSGYLQILFSDQGKHRATNTPKVRSRVVEQEVLHPWKELAGGGPLSAVTRERLAKLLASNKLEDQFVEIEVADTEPGGMLRLGVPQYRLPREVLDKEIGMIKGLKLNKPY
jgi:ATP-dependent protease HslVU (ClpYQ) ATPase subunit